MHAQIARSSQMSMNEGIQKKYGAKTGNMAINCSQFVLFLVVFYSLQSSSCLELKGQAMHKSAKENIETTMCLYA